MKIEEGTVYDEGGLTITADFDGVENIGHYEDLLLAMRDAVTEREE